MGTTPAVPRWTIREGSAGDLALLKEQWTLLYQQQVQQGMLFRPPADGHALWASSLGSVLGRFGCLFVAEEDGAIVGFLAGRLRSLPPHFGGEQVGYVSEVFVDQNQRGKGIGKALLLAGTQWFRERGAKRLELNVVAHNDGAALFYEKMGWTRELIQMVSMIE